MKLDILAFAAHPDDVELSCAGTMIKHARLGKKIGIVDLTQGQLGTRGTPETRLQEAADSAKIMGLSVRDNLGMADGFFKNDKEHQLKIINKIRKYQPEIVFANAISDRHPDHGRASQLVSESCFYSGLRMIETIENGEKQQPWRPKAIYHYIQYSDHKPDFVVDITDEMETKMETVKAFRSQFYNPKSKEPLTVISSPEFLEHLYRKAAEYGRFIGAKYAEGFTVERYIGVNNIFDLK